VGALIVYLGLAASPIYSIADLGPATRATSINNQGQVAGWFTDSTLTDHPLYPLVSFTGQTHGINDAGQTVGFTADGQAAIWTSGALALLAGPESYALAINGSGQIAGAIDGQPVRWSNGVAETLGATGAGYAIDSAGNVAGTGELAPGVFRAFFWSPQTGLNWLPTLGGPTSYGLALNGSGQIAGNSTTTAGYLHAFLRTGAGMADLGALAGAATSSATGLNGSGQVVGVSGGAAFLYANGILIDLNLLIDPFSGWTLQEAAAINDSGQIAGTGLYQGQRHAFLLDPARQEESALLTPEPASIFLLLLGLALLAFGVSRRKG